jgi:hypothetical protein
VTPSRRTVALGASGLASLFIALFGVFLPARLPGLPARERDLPPAAPLAPVPVSAPLALADPAPHPAPLERATDGVAIMPQQPLDTAVAGPMHPHPHTPAHERIYRENLLLGQLSGAMDQQDLDGLRHLLRQYREEFPEDAHRLQDGYALIADCLEASSPATRARAEGYWREQRGSTLRRYVRRHCLDPRP